MGVDVHGGGEISMSHYLLDELNVVCALAKSGAEGVP